MTSDAFRMVLVTDAPHQALAGFLGCAFTNKPRWLRVVFDPVDILKIPDGTKCRGMWFHRRTGAEFAWWERRDRGGLVWLNDADLDFIADWIAETMAAMEARAAAYPDRIAAPDAQASDAKPEAPALLPAIAKAKPEIENLILSQRWR